FFVILIVHCIYICGGTEDQEEFSQLIVGGYRRNDTELTKYIVIIKYGRHTIAYGDNHICGGAIISKSSVLTAAHCLILKKDNSIEKRPANKLSVVAGSKYRLQVMSTTQTMEVSESIVHPSYDGITFTGDIGLLLLTKSFAYDGTTVAPIPLATETPKENTKCIVGGWGSAYHLGPYPDNILFADHHVLDEQFCPPIMITVAESMICAESIENKYMCVCNGDSGGPLLCNGFVCGVVSRSRKCDYVYPALYTNVAYYRNWILNHINSSKRQSNSLSKLIFFEILLILCLLYAHNMQNFSPEVQQIKLTTIERDMSEELRLYKKTYQKEEERYLQQILVENPIIIERRGPTTNTTSG
ncbi:hypodermin-B-like, partial [Teleopsis dalmanni]|uniref:hypodermin-B-like n=1 Tax=Teleopsis dalmanni TaxID=139649 RepID=UPI0018CE6663